MDFTYHNIIMYSTEIIIFILGFVYIYICTFVCIYIWQSYSIILQK